MEIRQGYAYHIKNEFFDLVKDKYLMSNKENDNYRPHFYAIKDKLNKDMYWMIPISSQVEKYKKIVNTKIKRYGKCNTIIFGKFAGKENAFLIQNTFPILEKYLDHVHEIQGTPIKVHKNLNKNLDESLREILAMYECGVKLIFTDIDNIKLKLQKELESEQL